MAITFLTASEVLQACPANMAAAPALNMVAAISFLNCVSTGRAVLHIPLPLAPFKQCCIWVFLVLFVILAGHERMILEMALGADLHEASSTDKRFGFRI